jgi:lysophospholipase L1-like esterase
LVRAGVFVALLVLLLEGFFRWVLPGRESPLPVQEPVEQLMTYDPAVPTGLFTSGRLAQQRARWRINGHGWNAAIPYLPASERGAPLIAFVGDSQWEGLYVEWADHVAAQTTQAVGVPGYAFGGSGYRISHYARVARYLAHHDFAPNVIVYYINRGDFWAGVANLGGRRGGRAGQQIRYDAERHSFEELDGAPYRTTRFRRLLRKSAFVRYAVFNAGVNPLRGNAPAEMAMVARTAYPEDDPDHAPMIEWATDWLLDVTAEALPDARIVFMIDADRRAIERGERPAPRLGASTIIQRVCARRGCTHLDLTPAFTAAYDASGKGLNFPHNYHWNAHGHAVAAQALAAVLKPLITPDDP